jgi:ribosome recycling factor
MTADVLAATREKMEKSVQALRQELAGVRAGRANPALLEKIRVEYYGTATPLQQIGSITAPDPRTLAIQVWDRGAVPAVEKAIQRSDLGLTPQTEGNVVRLVLPQPSAERRAELVKHARRIGEEQRIAIRNLRREAREQLERQEKAGEIAGDEAKRGGDELQKITDRAMAQVGQLVEAKEREISEV